ncbi:MAG TPA: MFS transporter [bacterium]|nr:MFS transporter [bacterium]
MATKEKSILAVTVASHAITHMAELTFPATALLVTQEFFGKGEYSEIGFAAFVSALLFGAAALPSGRLVDRLGSRAVLLLFLFGTGASLWALSLMRNFTGFTVALASLGLFSGLYHPAGTTMISLGIAKHGRAMGAHGVGGNLGLAATPFLAAALAGAVGWHWAYAVIGSLPIVLGIAVLASGIEVEQEREPAGDAADGANNNARPYLLAPLLLLFSMAVFNGMTYRGLMTFLPAYFAENVHLSWLPLQAATVGGTMTTAVLLLGVVGQYLGGNLADRYKKEKLYSLIFLLACPAMFVIGRLDNLPLVLTTAGFAFFYFMSQPIGNAILPRYTAPRVRGIIFGLFFFTGFGAGSFMSWIAGAVGDKYSLGAIFIIFAACLLAASSLGIFLIRSTRNVE